MYKKGLSEQEIRTRFITPALRDAGWSPRQIRGEYFFTEGRMHIQGQQAVRGKRSFVDYLLTHNNVQLAIVEAKDSD